VNARNSILLVDADATSLRVLEVSLRKVGYDVRTAETAAAALQAALTSPPDLVITDTQLPDYDGFDLCRRIRRDPRTQHAVLVFLAADATPDSKVRGIDVGADEFLTKPVLVKEIVSRVRNLLERRASAGVGGGGLSGTLANMGIVDVLQVMEAGSKSGTVRVVSDPVRSGGFVEGDREEGVIFFRDGRPVDAQLGRLRGVEAIYRLLLWEDGVFEAQFGPVEREDSVGATTQEILLEGLQRVDAWSQNLQFLPSLRSRLRVDLEILGRRRAPPPRDVQDLIARFDGRRTLFEVIASSPLDEIQTLRVIALLNEDGALLPADESTGDVEALEAWLATSEPGPGSADLPTALEHAMIPSPQTPSEILTAEQPGSSRVPLTRQTLPASYVGPLPSRAPAPAEPAPAEPAPPARPSLRVQRVPSAMPTPGTTAGSTTPASPPRRTDDAGWDTVEIPRSIAESFRDPTAAPGGRFPGRPAGESAAPEAPGWPSLPPRPAGPTTSTARASQNELPTWDLGPHRPPAAPPAPAAGASAERARAAPAPKTPWAEPPETGGASVQAQAAALPENPSVYRPSETSTFRDDFFKEGGRSAEAGLDPKIMFGVFAILTGIVVFFVLQAGPGDAPEPDQAPAPTEMTPTEKARAAGAAPVATGTTAASADAGAPDAPADAGPADAGPDPDAAQKVEAIAARSEPEADPEIEPARRPARTAAPAPERTPRRGVRALVAEGQGFLQAGDIGRAEARFREALERKDDHPGALAGQALVYWERRRDEQARAYARRALQSDRRQPLGHLVLGLIAAQSDDRDTARESYERYLRLEPNGFYAEDVRASLETLR